jgi:hypothetical protein
MSMRVVKKENNIMVGLAFADTSQREIGVSQFLDNDLFSNAEVCTMGSLLFLNSLAYVLPHSPCSSNWA